MTRLEREVATVIVGAEIALAVLRSEENDPEKLADAKKALQEVVLLAEFRELVNRR